MVDSDFENATSKNIGSIEAKLQSLGDLILRIEEDRIETEKQNKDILSNGIKSILDQKLDERLEEIERYMKEQKQKKEDFKKHINVAINIVLKVGMIFSPLLIRSFWDALKLSEKLSIIIKTLFN